MITIVGTGLAHPETKISNKTLHELLGQDFKEEIDNCGINNRFSSLPLDYIFSEKNKYPSKSIKAATASPTSLGVKAARNAISSANISIEDIGLVIADCLTPWQTIPAEAARIAGTMEMKIPVYDLLGTGAPLSFIIDLLNSWKEERIPDYILYVVTNTPTQRILYTGNNAGIYCGDIATAVILSTRKPGRIKINDYCFGMDNHKVAALKTMGSLSLNIALYKDIIAKRKENLKIDDNKKYKHVICPFCQKDSSYISDYGYNFGAEGMANLALKWNEISTNDTIKIIDNSITRGYGYIVGEAC